MINYIKPSIFPENVLAGVSKKYDSNGNIRSFFISENYNYSNIVKSRMQLQEQLSDKINLHYYQNQKHQDNIHIIDSLDHIDKSIESDAVITNQIGILLNASIADCISILIYDPVEKVIANIHSGWRGTKLNICKKAINQLKSNFNSNPKNLIIYISPSASKENYEIEKDVAQYFPEYCQQISPKKYLFDNKQAVLDQLLNNGANKNNIESSNICTLQNDNYHSYRREGIKSGRMTSFIGMLG